MTRRTFITTSTGALIAPMLYAMTPPQGASQIVKMEAPRDLVKDMRAIWLAAIDLTTNDNTPGKIIVKAHTWEYPDDPHCIPHHMIDLHELKPDDLPKFLEKGRVIVDYSLIEALLIVWMDKAANIDRHMTEPEAAEYWLQLHSFDNHPVSVGNDPRYLERLASSEYFTNDKFYKGKLKTPMQERICSSITMGGMLSLVDRISRSA